MELHAAEALLQLRCAPTRATLEFDGAKTLLLNCTPPSKSQPPASALLNSEALSVAESAPPYGSYRDDNSESETNTGCSFDSPISYRHLVPAHISRDDRKTKTARKVHRIPPRNMFLDSDALYKSVFAGPAKTCDKGTQTNEDMYQKNTLTDIKNTSKTISDLNARIHSLEIQLEASQKSSLSPLVCKPDPDGFFYKQESKEHTSSSCITANNVTMDKDYKWEPSKDMLSKVLNSKENDMEFQVPIGEGYASVPARVLEQIDWCSYTSATRKLLAAVFSRRTLATHSLTGKASPAFPGKPSKKQLDPHLVGDIVQLVSERCHVPKNLIRTIITTKCADETRMFRQQNYKQQLLKMNQENVPPSPYDEFSDYNQYSLGQKY